MVDTKKEENTLEALWCVDSESGIEYLIDIHTNEKLLKRIKGIVSEV